jgi:N-acetyltransferase
MSIIDVNYNMLIGNHVVLEPMLVEHVDALSIAVTDGKLWKLWYTLIPSPDKMFEWINTALNRKDQGLEIPFVVRKISNGNIIGTTKLMNIDVANNRLEIGSTWYSKTYQKTMVNTECKLLLLRYVFEELKYNVVEFRTHYMNHQSRAAIQRLGAKQDGILRNHMIMPDGTLRDTVVFSILNTEWPTAKTNLLFKLGCL